jgi:hypothetical protein
MADMALHALSPEDGKRDDLPRSSHYDIAADVRLDSSTMCFHDGVHRFEETMKRRV